MDDSPASTKLIKKAVLLAAKFLGLSIIGFVLLVLLQLYVPESMLLNEDRSSYLKARLPDKKQLPEGMILIREQKNTNEDIAENYPNEEEMLKTLKEFGREEGFAQKYVSIDRCRTTGPRSIYLSLISHNSIDGAEKYLQWILERDGKDADWYQVADVGDTGYMLLNVVQSPCSAGEKDLLLEVSFRSHNLLVTVRVSAAERKNKPEDLIKTTLTLARVFEKQLAGVTTVK